MVFQHPLRPEGGRGDPSLHANAPTIEILGSANAALLVDVDVGVPKHAFDENRDGSEAQFFERQVGDISAREELAYIEIAARRLPLPLHIIIVHSDSELDALGLDGAVDQGPGAVVRPACHAQPKRHRLLPSAAKPRPAPALRFGIPRRIVH